MGFYTFAVAGIGFILIGAFEALTSFNSNSTTASPNQLPSSPFNSIPQPTQSLKSKSKANPSSSSLSFIFISIFSFFFIVNSLVSLIDANNSSDSIGAAVQLQVLAIALVFLLYSVLGLLVNFTNSFSLPSSLLSLVFLFAFVEEFLLFYLQRKDPSGIENRYYDLLLAPITICVFSTIFELKSPKSNFPKLARGVGLILQGTWFLQMGLSFFSNLMAHGCYLHEKSRGNYTVKCKGHPDYHRARGIATLQFNCHLALNVVILVGVYSIISWRNGGRADFSRYRPLGEEMRPFENRTQFTLDSDDDVDEEIKEENVSMQKASKVELGMNGNGSIH
ncbi:Transmembrane protein like [Quillaja saponaria]|uniref:Transmembrane protein like n=1 Tax=Quillaja saponaria TaxID=32244 RepID=A0AAD7PXC9_QUISA|nr:Transmembrane protein like [Quillaja saponaria]